MNLGRRRNACGFGRSSPFAGSSPWSRRWSSRPSLCRRMPCATGIVASLADQLDSDVELGDLHLRVFPGLRVDGADLRIRRRGMGDYPPLISIKSFHVDASLDGPLAEARRLTCASTGSTSTFRPARRGSRETGNSQKQPLAEARRRPADGGRAAQRSAEERRRRHRSRGHERRAADHPAVRERQDSRRSGRFTHLHMRDVGSTAAVAVQGDAHQRRASRRDRRQRHVRSVAPRRAWRHAARGRLQFREGRPRRLQGHLRARCRRRATSAARSRELDANGETDTPDFTIAVGGHPFPLHVTVPGAHRRHQRRHAAERDRRVVPQLVPARDRRGARRAEGTARPDGDARRRDGQVAHRGHHEDGGEDGDAADGRRAAS